MHFKTFSADESWPKSIGVKKRNIEIRENLKQTNTQILLLSFCGTLLHGHHNGAELGYDRKTRKIEKFKKWNIM